LALILIKDHFNSMAGHSHFKNMMHRKGRADKIRSKLFTKLSREITVSAKLGTPDPEMNPRLRAAVQAARAANMPKDNIERAIKKSQGNIDNSYEFSRYEGFGPGRTGVIIEVLTDNKNRSVSNIRTIFQKFGGTLGETGSVSYQFEQIGQIKIKKELMSANDALELAINSGAEDCVTTDLHHEINCKKEEFNSVREQIEKKIKDLSFAGLIWNPLSKVNLDKETFTKVVNFLEQIEDDDDVQNVFTNFEVDEKLLEGAN
jgi:YebC/PmpR family DNA-binding regulatory protein